MDDTSRINIISSASELRRAEQEALKAAGELRDNLIRLPWLVLKPEEQQLIVAVDCWRKEKAVRDGK